MILLGVTYKQIATVTVTTATVADIEFTSIPGTYTDLILFHSTRYNLTSQTAIRIAFNSSTANFSSRFLQGNGSTVSSGNAEARLVGVAPGSSYTASTFGNGFIYIPNYAGSTNKSFSVDEVNENNATLAYSNLIGSLWSNTAAITSISLSLDSGSFVQYSSATLYGISKS